MPYEQTFEQALYPGRGSETTDTILVFNDANELAGIRLTNVDGYVFTPEGVDRLRAQLTRFKLRYAQVNGRK